MVNPKKKHIVDELQEKLTKVKALVLVDYTGLSVPQQARLRKEIKQSGAEFTVIKNTLFKLALKNSQYHQLDSFLSGPNATLFAYKDGLKPIKVLVKFIEEFELPQIKAGVFENQVVDKETILQLAQIPDREELLAKLVSLLGSPLIKLTNALLSPSQKLVFILAQIKKEGGEN